MESDSGNDRSKMYGYDPKKNTKEQQLKRQRKMGAREYQSTY